MIDTLFSHVVYWTWWIIGLVLIILEVSAPGTFFLWMGISAGIVGIALFVFPELAWEVQLTIFAIFSICSILISRRYLQKNGKDQSALSQRGKRYIGDIVVVEKSIENSSTPSNVFKVLVIIFTQPTPHIIPSTLYIFLVETANIDEIAKNVINIFLIILSCNYYFLSSLKINSHKDK